jgi:hypothetical protein
LQSFAYAFGISPEELIEQLGHDGTEIVAPDLPEPFCRRGFSVDELTCELLSQYTAVIQIPKRRYNKNILMSGPWFPKPDEDLILPELSRWRRYCLSNNTHMIGVRDDVVKDTMNRITDPKDFDYNRMYILTSID